MTHQKIIIPHYGNQQATIDNLTPEEIKLLLASILEGHHWVRGNGDGRLQHVSSYEELPGPITDDKMLPFWRQPTEGEGRQTDMFGFDLSTEAGLKHTSPSIYINSLCGYDYSAENYKSQAEQLIEWGFICMRSPRDPDSGKFWETWFLPGKWAVRGSLKEAISSNKTKSGEETFKLILEFLRINASFGSLDVSMQRIAMVMKD